MTTPLQNAGQGNMMGLQAAAMYKNMANIGSNVVSSSGADDSVSFAGLMREGIEKVVETQKKSEDMSAKAVTGEANMIDLVQATTEAEVVLRTAKVIRDRVIEAYNDILRMPI